MWTARNEDLMFDYYYYNRLWDCLFNVYLIDCGIVYLMFI